MNFNEAQQDMRSAYAGGGPGIIISGVVWITAGISALYTSPIISIMIFFFGGMVIHPLSMVLSKFMNRRGKHSDNNPLAKLAIESTLIIFLGLFIAYLIIYTHQEYFFPIMLMTIGIRYIIFQSIYGMKLYWIFGITLAVLGVLSLVTNQPFHIPAIIGGIVELIFAILIIKKEKTEPNIHEY